MKAMRDSRAIHELAPLVRAGSLSPVDLVRGCFARIDARPELNAFITLMREEALDAAHVAEREIAAGRYLGTLHGIPISIKDLVDIAGTRTTSGSHVPAPVATDDAPVVKRLRSAGDHERRHSRKPIDRVPLAIERFPTDDAAGFAFVRTIVVIMLALTTCSLRGAATV